jgi:hypothetical protein
MLTATLTVLNIRFPSIVYVNNPQTTGGHLMFKTVRGAVNINYWWMPYA